MGELALAVPREARENDLWLRCDCRIDIDDDPLVAPCRLPKGAGYSWRVLQGENRPRHLTNCAFYRESREERAERNWRRAARVPPEGYFAALQARKDGNSAELDTGEDGTALTDPLHAPGEDGDRKPGRRRMPAFSGLLCRLLETADLTRVQANEPAPGMGGWMDAMGAAAKPIEVAPGHPLDGLLFLWRTGWDRRRVHARVREAARAFPEGRVPQGFVCFPVRHVGERSLPATQKYGELEVASRIRRPTIGGAGRVGPVPVLRRGGADHEAARIRVRTGLGAAHRVGPPPPSRWIRTSNARPSGRSRRRCGYWRGNSRIPSFTMEKPVFEIDTEQGPCPPDFLIKVRRNGEVRSWVVEVMGFERPDYLAGKEVTHERMEEMGPVILMDGKQFKTGLTSEGRKVTETDPVCISWPNTCCREQSEQAKWLRKRSPGVRP